MVRAFFVFLNYLWQRVIKIHTLNSRHLLDPLLIF